jgi:anti-sigma-K factor RskA
MMLHVVACQTYFFRRLLRDRRLANDVNRWRVQFVRLARYFQPVATSPATITNMVSGVENLKSSDIKLVFI